MVVRGALNQFSNRLCLPSSSTSTSCIIYGNGVLASTLEYFMHSTRPKCECVCRAERLRLLLLLLRTQWKPKKPHYENYFNLRRRHRAMCWAPKSDSFSGYCTGCSTLDRVVAQIYDYIIDVSVWEWYFPNWYFEWTCGWMFYVLRCRWMVLVECKPIHSTCICIPCPNDRYRSFT